MEVAAEEEEEARSVFSSWAAAEETVEARGPTVARLRRQEQVAAVAWAARGLFEPFACPARFENPFFFPEQRPSMESPKAECCLCGSSNLAKAPFCGPLCESRHLQFVNGSSSYEQMSPVYFSLLPDEANERLLLCIADPLSLFRACAGVPSFARLCRDPCTIRRYMKTPGGDAMRAYLAALAEHGDAWQAPPATLPDYELLSHWVIVTNEQLGGFAAFAVANCLELILLKILSQKSMTYDSLVTLAIHSQSLNTLRFLFSLYEEFGQMRCETVVSDFCYSLLDTANVDLLEFYAHAFPWLLQKRQVRDQVMRALVDAAQRGQEHFFLAAMRLFDFSTPARHNRLTEVIGESVGGTAAMFTVCTRADNWMLVLIQMLKAGRSNLPARAKIMYAVETIGMDAVLDEWPRLCLALHERGSVELLFHLIGEDPCKTLLDDFVTMERRDLFGSALCITSSVLLEINQRLPRYRPPALLARQAANYGDLKLLELLQ